MVNSLIPMTRIDELLDGFLGQRFWPSQGGNGQTLRQLAKADVLEGEKDFLIRLDLPGVSKEGLDINLEDLTLTIKAERELPSPEGYRARSRELAEKRVFQRSFNLGREIDAERISAKLDKGVLTITLPKSETALPRRIDVK
jgi:HSP20 family molecular chaperone IbpA